ncbi:cryptochrome/photolyase family protein [Neptunomonas antarctica]|uniref:Deoxyribodipyrimidine photo-lyase n=1 Tax=Neptunomonas antarctica TaxID=619304 RepID=A0A1N7K6R7_9GAMM|nr:deoxyribodipyrimidine photo-lyase [Neptunomonas antarctica]SIS57269.1 deoxyribodipyrimidine photo-lyase [Neptunomonas antarctica]
MSTAIVWFRQDLRLSDNPALLAACKAGHVLPVYILDDVNTNARTRGEASQWWLHHSLVSLQQSLDGRLNFYRGDPLTILNQLIKETSASSVYWNRCYEPWTTSRDSEIKQALKSSGISVSSFNASLLWEPWSVLKKDETPYKVFTPYYRKGCLQRTPPREPLPLPETMNIVEKLTSSANLTDLNLLPTIPWDKEMQTCWIIGEAAAKQRLGEFLSHGLVDYKEGRNYPGNDPDNANVSRLSPHLHFGEISPNTVWYSSAAAGSAQGCEEDLDCFMSELGWREFSYYQLYHSPELPWKNSKAKFDRFPWKTMADTQLKQWQQGMTGFPIVDAGMRELWQTGYMHNRVRMVVGSFLVKNLLIDWRLGAEWFLDCLVDADPASNSAGWQWVAGCGADASPYFRIFNPVLQGQKFDSKGAYIRRYIPELAELPNKYIHCPWEAPQMTLDMAGVTLGTDYPAPMVDLKASRTRALDALKSIKSE